MQTTYGERLAKARTHAGLSQAELARRLELRPQAVQYLEDPGKSAQGSRYTSAFARECGVDANWLESGEGTMLAGDRNVAREERARYEVAPRSLAKAINALKPELRRALALLVETLAEDKAGGRRKVQLGAGESQAHAPKQGKAARRRAA